MCGKDKSAQLFATAITKGRYSTQCYVLTLAAFRMEEILSDCELECECAFTIQFKEMERKNKDNSY